MAFIKQKHKTDCGVAAIAMICDVTYEEADHAISWRKHGCLYGTDTKMLRAAAARLGYVGHGTKMHQLKRLTAPKLWDDLPAPSLSDWWYLIPNSSLVKVRHPTLSMWHWVAWRKGRVYDPARGVFTPDKSGYKPSAYMEFIKETEDV